MNLNMAKRIAKNSTHKTYMHVAIITKGSRVLSVGYNKGEEHAEAVAIKRLKRDKRNNGDLPRDLTLTSLMFKRKNTLLGNSKPCVECKTQMINAGIRYTTYVENGEFISV